jgi:hypothetical protein
VETTTGAAGNGRRGQYGQISTRMAGTWCCDTLWTVPPLFVEQDIAGLPTRATPVSHLLDIGAIKKQHLFFMVQKIFESYFGNICSIR